MTGERVLVDGITTGHVPADDRGLTYGDGLFETVLVVDGRAPLWSRHMARLGEGCRRLALPAPDPEVLWHESQQAAAGLPRAVVRITFTRGTGERGYAPPVAPRPLRVVSATPAPTVAADWYTNGIRVRFCDIRLGLQPVLAGLKHLNRLEQVLARAEWQDPAIAEGLLCDADGRVVCATAANLFLVVDGRPLTPALDRCGVAGVTRAEVLARRVDALIGDIGVEDVMRAEELFLTSSVRGIVPVTALPGRVLEVGPVARALGVEWRTMGLMPQASA